MKQYTTALFLAFLASCGHSGERFVERYPGGQKKLEGYLLDDGTKVADWIYWFENGQRASEGGYEAGQREGAWVYWYENGQRASEGGYEAGQREGAWVYWYGNGQRASEGGYEAGQKEGARIYSDTELLAACKANLKKIYIGLMEYKSKYRRLPSASGVKFFGALMSHNIFENIESEALSLTCTAVNISNLEIGQYEPEEWFVLDNYEILDGEWSSYAGRDMENYPLQRFPASGNEALIADDNAHGSANHNDHTCVLWGNGSITSYSHKELRDMGILGPEETLIVGPDSQIKALRKLTLD